MSSSYPTVRSQLASIMAAVAEMCALLDESYAALQMELSRSHRENEALRSKLQLLHGVHGGTRGDRGDRGEHREHRGPALLYAGKDEPCGDSSPGPETKVKKCWEDVSPSDTTSSQGPPTEATLHLSLRLSTAEEEEEEEEEADVVVIKEEDTDDEYEISLPQEFTEPEEKCAAGPSVLPDPVPSTPAGGATHRVIDLTPEACRGGFSLSAAPAPAAPAAPDAPDAPAAPAAPQRTWSTPSLRLEPELGVFPLQDRADLSDVTAHRPAHRADAFPFLGLSASQLELSRLSSGVGGERRFGCNYCGKCFSSARGLETHIRVHTGERPFCCAQCGKRFTQSGHLKTHQSVHTGDRPHPCLSCGKRFAGKQNLRLHQQKHHPQDPHPL